MDSSMHPNLFAAELLERSASGYAGYAASLLIERHPEISEHFAPNAFGTWKSHLTQRILELSAALSTGEPKLFAARASWSKKAFLARKQDVTAINASLDALNVVLTERLPDLAASDCDAYIETALNELEHGASEPDASVLDPSHPAGRLALQYIQHVLEGNAPQGIRVIVDAIDSGMNPVSAYTDVLLPSQLEIGRLWHLGDMSIAEEHLVTSATQRAMAVISNSATVSGKANGKTVVSATVATNAHDVGLRAISDIYQLAGWRSVFLGADIPARDLPASLTYFEADILLLAATLSTHIPKLAEAIQLVRDRCDRDVKIIIGGSAFDDVPNLWARIGADGYAQNADDAVKLGNRLAGI